MSSRTETDDGASITSVERRSLSTRNKLRTALKSSSDGALPRSKSKRVTISNTTSTTALVNDVKPLLQLNDDIQALEDDEALIAALRPPSGSAGRTIIDASALLMDGQSESSASDQRSSTLEVREGKRSDNESSDENLELQSDTD